MLNMQLEFVYKAWNPWLTKGIGVLESVQKSNKISEIVM